MTGNEISLAIAASGKSIYDPIDVGDPQLWLTNEHLEEVLQSGLIGLRVLGLPPKRRSKVVKGEVARILGYPVPSIFTKTQPRFLGQNFDTYVQKANNLQIWNEGVSPSRRYVLVRVDENDVVTRVKVVMGEELLKIKKPGPVTIKYQASFKNLAQSLQSHYDCDTDQITLILSTTPPTQFTVSPTTPPTSSELISTSELFSRLSPLIGMSYRDLGSTQDRNRGTDLHRLVCTALGYQDHKDTGQFPDVPHQLLEVKLQTSPTIDLGKTLPTSQEALTFPMQGGIRIRNCDVRYAVFLADIADGIVTLRKLVITPGESFFERFSQFQGKVINWKLQIALPSTLFDS